MIVQRGLFGSGTVPAWVSLCSLPLKNFSAFGFPHFSVLRLAEIDAEFLRDHLEPESRVVRSVVAEIREHFDLFEVGVRFIRLWPGSHWQILSLS